MNAPPDLMFDFEELDQRAIDIQAIHMATAFYTVRPEVEALLDRLNWPDRGSRLLDPGAGDGVFVISALSRLNLEANDVESAASRVTGYEFYGAAVATARRNVSKFLRDRGWKLDAADDCADRIIEQRDFLLEDVPKSRYDVIAANPPYWRYANIPAGYRSDFDLAVDPRARADLQYAYLDRCAEIITKGGLIGLITSDRWLSNANSAQLRARIGAEYSVEDVFRLGPESTYYAAKTRRAGTPPRVHPVTLVLSPDGQGRRLSVEPFTIDDLDEINGELLTNFATIKLAPWLGPDGVFIVSDPTPFPSDLIHPAVLPTDIRPDGALRETTRWVIRPIGTSEPPASVSEHLLRGNSLMPPRGRQQNHWTPPEGFGPLPLSNDAVLVPRIAKHLTAVRLPAGHIPVNHGLVVINAHDWRLPLAILQRPELRDQADKRALGLENGYHSYTASLLRQLVIPHEVVAELSNTFDMTPLSQAHSQSSLT